MLSKTSQYALRAVLHLARPPVARRVSATEIAEALGVPANYLSKILHSLGRAGILTSERGPHGGFALARRPEAIALADILAAFDELTPDQRCLLGRGRCLDTNPCPAHEEWKAVSERVYGFFDDTTVADLQGRGLPASALYPRGDDDDEGTAP